MQATRDQDGSTSQQHSRTGAGENLPPCTDATLHGQDSCRVNRLKHASQDVAGSLMSMRLAGVHHSDTIRCMPATGVAALTLLLQSQLSAVTPCVPAVAV